MAQARLRCAGSCTTLVAPSQSGGSGLPLPAFTTINCASSGVQARMFRIRSATASRWLRATIATSARRGGGAAWSSSSTKPYRC